MTETSPFASQWPPAPAAIDYVAAHLRVCQTDACIELQRRLVDGSIRARGPVKSAIAVDIESEFWRFALPDPQGEAVNLSSLVKLPWFEVAADDVLKIWPDGNPAVLQTAIRRKPLRAADDGKLLAFLKDLGPCNADAAHKKAVEHFNAKIPRDRIRKLRRDNGLEAKGGRPQNPRGVK